VDGRNRPPGRTGCLALGWKDQRRAWYPGQLAARDIPLRAARIPSGALARMGIDA
jgi:hypothetical protein